MASFGAQLRQEREKRGVTLEEISQATKIGTRLLQALEDEKIDQLPGGIFNKGFIRAYARFLGMDDDQIVADYVASLAAAQPEKKSDSLVEDPRRIFENEGQGLPWGALAVLLLVVALVFALWGFYSRHRQTRELRRDSPTPAQSTQPAPQR